MASVVLLAACDQQGRFTEEVGLDKLAKGISGESDVRMVMGQPETVWEEESGARTLEYPKGPAGHRGVESLWVCIDGADIFVPLVEVTDVREVVASVPGSFP